MSSTEIVYRKHHPIVNIWYYIFLVFSVLVGVGLLLSIPSNVESTSFGIVLSLVLSFGFFLITAGSVLLIGWVLRRKRTHAFYEDRVVSEGLLYSGEVAYDEVALAVRTDALMKAPSVELVREGQRNLTLARLSDPSRVEDLLRSRLPSTAEVLEKRAQEGTRPHNRENALGWILQAYQANYQKDPDAPPMLAGNTFKHLTGLSASKADLNRLDEIYDGTSLSDLDPNDLKKDVAGGGDT